ncbi:MAG: phage holin family protein [Candidatus Limnocylindria bacterium]
MGFLLTTLVTAASLWVADFFIPGIFFEPPAYTADAQLNYWIALGLGAVVLGVLNAVVKPVLFMLSLPITCLTLGLFIIVLNGLILVLLSLIPFVGFRVDGILSAIIGAAVVSIASFLLQRVVPS